MDAPIMMPTADQIAAAMVAACKETGENPESFINRDPDMKARHYAFHALLHHFNDLTLRSKIAELVGCYGKSTYFHRASMRYIVGLGPYSDRQRAPWWDDEAFDRVINAIPISKPEPQPVPKPLSPPAQIRAARRSMNFGSLPLQKPQNYHDVIPMTDKQRAAEELRQAVLNTQKLQHLDKKE